MGASNGASDELLDLDALERDTTNEPYRFRAGGIDFTAAHPNELDWHVQQDLESGSLVRILPALLGDQFGDFDGLGMPGWKVEKLIEAWARHCGIEVGESRASSPSSVPTGGPSRPISATTTASASPTSPPAG